MYQFVPMNQQYADEVIKWHYDGIYAFYDMTADEEDLAEFLDPTTWDQTFAVLTEASELAGTYSYYIEEGVLWVGFGLKPEMTGQRLGAAFVSEGLDFGIEHFHYSGDRVMLAVATFNGRAIRLYEKLGFVPVEKYIQKTNGGEYEFLRMQKTLTGDGC